MNDTPENHEKTAGPPGQDRRVDAHLILALGVISVVVCPLTGPLAQVSEASMGEASWKAIRTGRRLGMYGTLGMLVLLLMVPLLYLLYFNLVEQLSRW